MATTSFSESLRYGGKLFGLFLAVLLVGGGALGAGAYLAVPEVQSYLDTGSVGTTTTAAGAALVTVGAVVLIVGQFALAYKLIADAVSRGTESAPAVFDAAEAGDERTETESETGATAETGAETEDAERPGAEPDAGLASDTAESPGAGAGISAAEGGESSADASAGTPAREPARGPEPAEESPAGPEPESPAAAAEEPASEGETAPAEQTAEEIAFGTRGDEKTVGPAESTADETTPEEESAVEHEEYSEEDREGMETAGNPSSDPLADRFDDE